MFRVLKRTVSLRLFFWVPTTYVLIENLESYSCYPLLTKGLITVLNMVKFSYSRLISSFICMFHLFMCFRYLWDYSRKPCFFEYKGQTSTHHCSLPVCEQNKPGCLWDENSHQFHCLWRPLLFNSPFLTHWWVPGVCVPYIRKTRFSWGIS